MNFPDNIFYWVLQLGELFILWPSSRTCWSCCVTLDCRRGSGSRRDRFSTRQARKLLRVCRVKRSFIYGSRVGRDCEAILRPLRGQSVMFYYVYLLENKNDKSWYIGFTSNLRKRITEHQAKSGGQTTKRKTNWKLIYFEGYLDKNDTVGREKFLESGSGYRYLKKQLKRCLQI